MCLLARCLCPYDSVVRSLHRSVGVGLVDVVSRLSTVTFSGCPRVYCSPKQCKINKMPMVYGENYYRNVCGQGTVLKKAMDHIFQLVEGTSRNPNVSVTIKFPQSLLSV